MSNPEKSVVLKWIHPTYEMIYDIENQYSVQSQKESSQLYFDNITGIITTSYHPFPVFHSSSGLLTAL